jgi:hypothetical protein
MDSNKAVKKVVDEIMGYFGLEERAHEPLTAWANMLIGIGHEEGRVSSAKPSRKPVIQKTKKGEVIGIFKSLTEAAKVTRTGRTNISDACLGKMKTAGGYKWEFLNPNDYYKARQIKKL